MIGDAVEMWLLGSLFDTDRDLDKENGGIGTSQILFSFQGEMEMKVDQNDTIPVEKTVTTNRMEVRVETLRFHFFSACHWDCT